ncbi:MAG: Ig domain-containing protein [Eubacterium sp.]|nr:Ig domain-containing protein [Eubacterium sp.]
MCTGAHNQAAYLEYLRDEKDISEYKTQDEAKAALDRAANWRRVKLLSDVGANILGLIGIHCPVNVEIYDAKGQLAGKITNNIVDYINSDKIYISITDGQKDIYLLDNDAYTFKITAISDGTMEYVVQNIRTSDQSVVNSKTFANVNLTEGKQMISSVQPRDNSPEGTSIQTSEVQLFVLNDNGDAKTEVVADGNGTEIPVVDKVENPDNPDPGNTNTNTPGNPSTPGTSQPNPGNSSNQTDTTVKVEKIAITGLSHKIATGKKITLEAFITPSNATDKSITWKSSNTKYATVNSKGAVTIKKAGAGKTVTITATANDGSGKKASYKIKGMKGVVKKITISGQKTQNLKVGKSISLKAKVTASKGANKTPQWMSSNKKYATVTNKGRVTAKKAGKGKTVKITAMATDGSNRKASVKIKIR